MSVSTPRTTAAPLSARRSNRRSIGGMSCLPIGHASAILSGVSRRLLPALLAAASLPACQPEADRRGATVLFASGADLQSINPLLTQHPLARQVQRYVLLTTLARYDSALVPGRTSPANGAGARIAAPSPSCSTPASAGTTARRPRRATWPGRSTPRAIRRPAIPRLTDLESVAAVVAPTTRPWCSRFASPQTPLPRRAHRPRDPAGAPARHRAAGPAAAGGVEHAAGRQRPLPVRGARAEPPLGLRRRLATFRPRSAGRRALERLIIVVVDEPTTKLAALTSGELDFAGIQPAHADFVRRDPGARGAHLSTASHLWHRASTPGGRRSTELDVRRAVSGGDRPPGDRRRLPLRVRHAGERPGAARVPGYLPVASSTPPASTSPAVGGQAIAVRAAHRRQRRGAAGADGPGAARRRRIRRGDPAAGAVRVPGPGARPRSATSTPPCSASRATSASATFVRSPRPRPARRRRTIPRRRSACSPTRCRSPSSITRAVFKA